LTTARRVPWIDRTQPFLHGTSVHHFCNSFEKPSNTLESGEFTASLPSATTTRIWLFYTKIKLFSVQQLSFAPFIHADYHKRCRMRFVAVSCRSIALRNLIQKNIPQGIGSGATQKVFFVHLA